MSNTQAAKSVQQSAKPDYGVDAPAVMRNFFLIGAACLVGALLLPHELHLFRNVSLDARSLVWPGAFLTAQGCLFLLYVKVGKFRHRDFLLGLHAWRGDEQVLDVGTGRGLLLAGAAKRTPKGHATGLDIWSTVDMGGNAPEATQHNLVLEGMTSRCTLLSQSAAEMTFPDATFDVIVSNLCLHNMYDKATRLRALGHIARTLKPGGVALLSDYKLTAEYAEELRRLGLEVTKKRGSVLTTFPPLTVVIARKAASNPA